MAETESDLQQLQSVSDSVAEYFCEDPKKFKLDECCSIFNSFCEKFMRAMQVSLCFGMCSFAEARKTTPDRSLNCTICFAGKQGSRGGRGAAETQRQIAEYFQAQVHSHLLQQRQGNGRSCIRVRTTQVPQQSWISEETRKAVIF